tara:strand:+ start:3470 stop:3715 length:246 start_codon:yes stop_codon:yes gene_type:complete
MSIEYRVEEWSVDTRKWVIKSPRKLTNEEVFEIYNEHVGFFDSAFTLCSHGFEGIEVIFTGTEYGDNSEYEIYGDFKEEEE